MTKSFRSVVRGIGSCLPTQVVTNAEMAKRVDTSDDWITQRTGIKQRYIAGEGETTSTLGTRAAEIALERAGLKPRTSISSSWRPRRPTTPFPPWRRQFRPRSA